MGNILTSILATSASMRAFGQGLNVTQTNVTNASTPGYVKQTQVFESDTFELSRGLPGGVKAGKLLSSRNEYAELAVRRNQQDVGAANQRSTDLAMMEPIFSLQQGSGVPGALSNFFQSFNQLSVTPNSNPSRQAVLDSANELANSFNQTATQLQQAGAAADHSIRGTVDTVNSLLTTLQTLNGNVRQKYELATDPTFDAKVHNTLEQLSEYVDFTAIPQADGTNEILIGGQTTALIGDHLYPLQTDVSNLGASVLDSQGNDISSQLTSGRLAGLLTTRNKSIPSYLDSLNSLASSLADKVNETLANGVDANGNAPSQNLFQYDSSIGAAQTLKVNSLVPSDLAAALSDAPGGNGNALVLTQLANTRDANGYTYTQAYANIGAALGRELSTAKGDATTNQALLDQARSFRSDESGVSLDDEAATLIAFQRSYQASAKLVSVLNELTQTLLGILQ